MAIDYNLHPVFDVLLGTPTQTVRMLLGDPHHVKPIGPGAEMWMYANTPPGHIAAVMFAQDKVGYLELRLDREPNPITVMTIGDQGCSTAISYYGVSGAASLLLRTAPVTEKRIRQLQSGIKSQATLRIDPPGTALKHLESILDRGLDQPGVRSHVIGMRADKTGVKVRTFVGAGAETIREDRISYLWRLPDERVAVMEVAC